MATSAITQNTTVQNGTVDNQYTGLVDLTIREEAPTFNYDGADLALGDGTGDNSSCLFNPSGLSNITASSTINSATLYVYGDGGFGSFDVTAHQCLRAWVQTEATFNIYATASSWTTAGGVGAGDIAAATSAAVTVSAGGYIAFTVTDEIQAIVDGAANNGVLLRVTVFDNDGGFRAFTYSGGTDGQRSELIIDHTEPASETIDTVTGDIAPGQQIVIDTTGLGTHTVVTLGGESLTIDSTATNQSTVTIPMTIDLRWGSTTYTLSVGDGTNTATLTNQTLAVPTGWAVIDYNGVIPNPSTTESFYELAVNFLSFTPVTPDQLQYTTNTGMTVDGQTIPDVTPPANVSGSYAFYDDSAGTRTAQRTYSIINSNLTSGSSVNRFKRWFLNAS